MSNTNCKVNQHFKQKLAEILKIDLDWQKIWKTFHENKAENKIKSDIFCQLHLNFFTPFMAFKNQVQASAICNLCERSQLEQHHKLISCIVTKRLLSHFETFLTAISPEILEEKEMVIGLGTDPKAQKHQKFKEFIYFYNKKHSSPKQMDKFQWYEYRTNFKSIN